jgi:hypothetical protein
LEEPLTYGPYIAETSSRAPIRDTFHDFTFGLRNCVAASKMIAQSSVFAPIGQQFFRP